MSKEEREKRIAQHVKDFLIDNGVEVIGFNVPNSFMIRFIIALFLTYLPVYPLQPFVKIATFFWDVKIKILSIFTKTLTVILGIFIGSYFIVWVGYLLVYAILSCLIYLIHPITGKIFFNTLNLIKWGEATEGEDWLENKEKEFVIPVEYEDYE